MKHEIENASFQDKPLPSPGVPVWVQCQGYRCLAARDSEGHWKTYASGLPIDEVPEVLPFPG